MSKIGRNDPCPCGSGRKYKHCCLRREEAEARASAAEVMDELRAEMAGRDFGSMEELQAFTNEFMNWRNRAPVEDFQGLSSEQMMRFLHFPFDSPEYVRFAEKLESEPEAPIMRLFALMAEAMADGLKPTAKGNLPRKFCRDAALAYLGEEGYREETRFGGINKEEDFMPLHVARLVAEIAGLIRKYKGKFVLSRKCRELIEEGGPKVVYPLLFRAYVREFNWAYWDRYPELQIVQGSFVFTLYLLARFGDSDRSRAFYESCFLQAFPMALEEVGEEPILGPERLVRGCYTLRALRCFVGFFGLGTVVPIGGEILPDDYRVKAEPLLREMVQFSPDVLA